MTGPPIIGMTSPRVTRTENEFVNVTASLTVVACVDHTPLSDSFLTGLGFGAGVRHIGRNYADTLNILAPSATVFDAALPCRPGASRLAAHVSDLFERAYVAACPSAGARYAANLRRATFSLGCRL